jgi:hypothetical protein
MNGSLWQPALADQSPPQTEGPAQKVRQVGGTREPLGAPPGPHSLGEIGHQIDDRHELPLDVALDRAKLVDRPGNEDGKQAVVGREGEDHPRRPHVEL